ncbi:MAG: phosphoenolpyruvate carboxykinase (ATP), partial [Caldilineaceae bacterium]|nr:phosphoenolpyruvate carboxykinase (ATP) [Caldilineaceae bacterium]
SGYTAKVAGTERGVTEPQATFSACFGAPFMPLHPSRYAELLGEKIRAHGARVWLVNTGWTGGPHGVGYRMPIKYTRAMVNAALDGVLDHVATTTDPVFGFAVPTSCPGVPAEVLIPANTWQDKDAYNAQARKLADDGVRVRINLDGAAALVNRLPWEYVRAPGEDLPLAFNP